MKQEDQCKKQFPEDDEHIPEAATTEAENKQASSSIILQTQLAASGILHHQTAHQCQKHFLKDDKHTLCHCRP